jgi:hypothetical protein
LFDLARSLATLIHDADTGCWKGVPARERQLLIQRCTYRAVELLRQACDRGLRDPDRIESDDFKSLAGHSGYKALVAVQKSRQSQPSPPVKASE